MDFLIITGLSGAGKSRVIDSLEDIGYYCVDNIPPMMLGKFHELASLQNGIDRVAVVIDIRGGELFSSFFEELDKLRLQKKEFRLMYIDCSFDELINRFKETRRKHPLVGTKCATIRDAISTERDMLRPARDQADYIIDTTQISPAQLKDRIGQMFTDEHHPSLMINIVSFGFKYGAHDEADLMFDVRCFPNPYYVPELREQTGLDAPVRDYVMQCEQTKGFLTRLFDMIDYLLPLYLIEGKSQLVVGIGCTGGKHRSVAISEALGAYLRGKGNTVVVTHRDKDKTK